MSPHSAPVDQALQFIHALLTSGRGCDYLELDVVTGEGKRLITWHARDAGARDFAERVLFMEAEGVWLQVLAGLARKQRGWGTAAPAPCVWARVETKDAARRLARFRPAPSLVLREGASARRVAVWWTRKQLGFADQERANARLSWALGGRRGFGDPDAFRLPLPGTFLRAGRTRPCGIIVEQLEWECYGAAAVVKRLRDAPSKDAWMEGRL